MAAASGLMPVMAARIASISEPEEAISTSVSASRVSLR